MKLLLALYAWFAAHPEASVGAVLTALAVAWKSIPAAKREAIERTYPRVAGTARFVASLAADLLGAYRIFRHQIVAGEPRASVQPPAAQPPQPVAPTITTTLRDVERGGTGVRGYAKLDALAWALGVGALCFAAASLAGCPLPPPDGCTPRDTRCAPDGVPEVCSQGQRWTRGSPAEPCPERSSCCLARSPYGRNVHACVPPSACLPEQPVSAPSALVDTQ